MKNRNTRRTEGLSPENEEGKRKMIAEIEENAREEAEKILKQAKARWIFTSPELYIFSGS